MPKQGPEKPKRKLEPITSTLVVNWTKPEDDPIRYEQFCRFIKKLFDKLLAQQAKEKEAVQEDLCQQKRQMVEIPTDKLLDRAEVAEILQVSKESIRYRLCNTDCLVEIRYTGKVLFNPPSSKVA